MTDWGLPDWTKREEYPAPCGPGQMTVWAWEFLRRNPEYRVFWKEKIEPFIDMTGGDLVPHNELKAVLVRGGICRDAAGNIWPYLDELRARFGVDVPSPPHSSRPSFFFEIYAPWVENDGRESQDLCLEKHQIAIIFDLSRPLAPQFKRAHASAKREQEFREISIKTARRRQELYIPYLRILDARDAGAKPKDVGDKLFPKLSDEHPDYQRQKRLCNYQRAAEKLRDGGYRSLLVA
jgi:Uncharacterized conserved protein (DUF2285)